MSGGKTLRRIEASSICDALDPVLNAGAHDLLAPAKLNLRLKVLGRRPDGYHLLSMLNVSSTLQDVLSVSLTREVKCSISLASKESVNIATSDNSVTRIFTEYWREFGLDELPLGFSATLTKQIPIGAGLGGGSSDAGAMLRFLTKCSGRVICEALGLSTHEFEQRVMYVALRVGADVPYAYTGGVCWVTGIGEVVRKLDTHPVWPGDVLITVPPAPVATAAFYQFFREQHPAIAPSCDEQMEALVRSGKVQISPDLLQNDFERDVCTLVPAVGTALRCARDFFPQSSSLTGSGSAIFSLVGPEDSGRIEPYCVEAERERMTVHRVRLLDA